jgi:uncharacterized repeat protein (TIGR01451 family)
MRPRRAAALLALAIAIGAAAGAALGFWTGGAGQPLTGSGAGAATTVNAGSTPTVTTAGTSSVVISWSASTMANGGAVSGYIVKRYDASTNTLQTIGSGCSGTISATTCTETKIPVGSWKYTVTPAVGTNWRGTESAKSSAVTTTTIDFLQPITSPETVRVGPAGGDVGDVNNDGRPDIVTSALFEAATSVLVNNGVGDFRENTVISNAATVDAKLGKFDSDSNLDLALLYQLAQPGTGLLILFRGGGDGTFTYISAANEIVNTGIRSTKMAVGNFNGDPYDDVAVVNSQSDPNTQNGTVTTYLGGGGDAFSASTPAQTLTAQLNADDIAFGDFNGGTSDLVVTNVVSNSVTFLPGNGTGFGAPTNTAAGAPVYLMDTADLNGDGKRDIAASVSNANPSTVRILQGDGAGGFPTQSTVTAADPGTGGEPQGVVASDLNNDGDKDLAVANGEPKGVSVLDNHGNGTFTQVPTSPETSSMGGSGTYPFEVLAGDFDGDGYNDLTLSNVFTSPGENRTLLNQSGNQANLSITQSDSPDPVNAGSNLTYTLTVANAGPSNPTSVKASDTLPAGVTFNAAASSSTCSAAGSTTITVTCDYGSVASGSPESQQVVVTVGGSAPASISNTATVAGNLADPTPANNTSSGTTTVNLDATPPTNSFSLNSASGAYLAGGSTLYYKGDAVGSFKLVDAVADSGTGPASATYSAIATTGWTHAAETVSTPSGGPYTSTTFSWTASPTNPTGYSVSGKDNANNATAGPITFVSDTTAPAGGSVSYTNGMVYHASVPVTTANGTDGGSGVNAGSGIIKRAQATLNTSTQVCGTFGGYTTTVTLTGGADTSVVGGNCYQYEYLVSDNVGNQATYTSASVAKVDTTSYTNAVLGTTGLLNYYRLGENTVSSDSFTGTAGTALSSHTGETGATWSTYGSPQTTAVLSDANRVRRNGVGNSAYNTSGTPPSADYSVQADIVVKSVLAQDAAALVARAVSGDNYYLARYIVNGATAQWELDKVAGGTATAIATSPATLTAGQTYTVKLTLVGTLLTMSVNGSQIASLNDGTYSAAGNAGVRLGFANAIPAPTNTTGLHLDNFNVMPLAHDGKSTNEGTYWNGPSLAQTGAIAGDSNTAAQFDGVNDYVTATRQIQDDFSIEFWLKSTQGLNTNAQWWGNAGLVDGEVSGTANDFGVSLRSDGKVVAGTGNPDTSIVSSSGGYNNGGWHHVVFTRTKATGALALYVDGSSAGTATGNTLTLNGPATLNLGRIATGTFYYSGTLDEVALYSSAISQATVTDHYARR